MNRSLRSWTVACALMVLLLLLHLWAAFSIVSHGQFRSAASIVAAGSQGPIRLLLPIFATLICAPVFSAELDNRFIVSVRSRIDLRRFLVGKTASLVGRCFLLVFVYAAIATVAVYWLAPALYPTAVDPTGYNTDAAGALQQEFAVSPLARLLGGGPLAYVIGTAAWTGVFGAAFGLVAIVATVLVRRWFVAWLLPLGLYLVQSLVFQLVHLPAASFLVAAVYPSGLTDYPLWQSVVLLLALVVVAVAVFVAVLVRAPRAGRFA